MVKTLNIFILAAGLGERLQPITHHIPKPLLPVLGKPSLQHVLDHVSSLPFNEIGINLHHRKKAVEEWAAQCSIKERIRFFPEESMLGTGGGLKNAEGFLQGGTFLVHNSDILSDIHLEELVEHHHSSGNLVTLAVHDYPKFNSLTVDTKGLLRDVQKKGDTSSGGMKRSAFTGIAVYEPGFLAYMPEGPSSVVDGWLKAVDEGDMVGTFNVSGCYWADIGTPSAYASAVFDRLRAEGEIVYVHPSVKTCANVDLQGYVVIEEDCVIGKNVSLRNCVLLPGSRAGAPHESTLYKNCIIGDGYTVDLNGPEVLELPGEEGRQVVGTGGSDRTYYRIKKEGRSVISMQCKEGDADFQRHTEYTRFFIQHSVPVPALISEDSGRMQAEFEDAGDISLYSYLKCPRSQADIIHVCKKVINAVVSIHTIAKEHVPACQLLAERIFDYEYFRWETDYFIERFVKGVRNIRPSNMEEIEKEFHALALRADSFPKTVIHRDFQSQNIMVVNAQEIRLIDFQGARTGPPAYDVASMLWDPYCRFEDNARAILLDYYIDQMKHRAGEGFDAKQFVDSLIVCRLQRHMQALGAYGFLSLVKGKKYFLKYIPEGVRLLKEDMALSGEAYPELHGLVHML